MITASFNLELLLTKMIHKIYKIIDANTEVDVDGNVFFIFTLHNGITIRHNTLKPKEILRREEGYLKYKRSSNPDKKFKDVSKYSKLYNQYKENDFSLSYLKNRFISISKPVGDGDHIYGFDIDVLLYVKEKIDSCNKKSFSTYYDIYGFLISIGRKVNNDNTITLRGDYKEFNVTKNNDIYCNNLSEEYVNKDNILYIYDKIYRYKSDETNNNLDVDTSYVLNNLDNPTTIQLKKVRHHKNSSKIVGVGHSDILKIGDPVPTTWLRFQPSKFN